MLVTLIVVLFGPTTVAAAVGGATLGLSMHMSAVFPRVRAAVAGVFS